MTALLSKIVPIFNQTAGWINLLHPLVLLGARLYVSWVFFLSGLTKIRDWDSTLFLFEEEYYVPLLSPELAAYMGTAGELGLPVLLVLGLASRFGALGLTFVNIVAVISLEEIADAALYGHVIWGLLMGLIFFWGAGKLSLDAWLTAKFNSQK